MKGRLKVAVIVNALVLAMTTPAWADSLDPSFERDMRMAFEIDGQPIEFVLLSEQEMRETQEAFVPAFAFITHWAIMDSDRQFLWRSHNRYAYDPLSASTAHFRPYVDGSSHYVLGFCGVDKYKSSYWRGYWLLRI